MTAHRRSKRERATHARNEEVGAYHQPLDRRSVDDGSGKHSEHRHGQKAREAHQRQGASGARSQRDVPDKPHLQNRAGKN